MAAGTRVAGGSALCTSTAFLPLRPPPLLHTNLLFPCYLGDWTADHGRNKYCDVRYEVYHSLEWIYVLFCVAFSMILSHLSFILSSSFFTIEKLILFVLSVFLIKWRSDIRAFVQWTGVGFHLATPHPYPMISYLNRWKQLWEHVWACLSETHSLCVCVCVSLHVCVCLWEKVGISFLTFLLLHGPYCIYNCL